VAGGERAVRASLAIVGSLLAACARSAFQLSPTLAVMKVVVTNTGQIIADGAKIELSALKSAFAKLSAENGLVIYYREDPGAAEPHPNATAVIEAIIEARLPVSLSTTPDFSTVLQADGTVKKRE
jgi:hypothetical protein